VTTTIRRIRTVIVDVHAHYYPPEYLERIHRPELPPVQSAPLRGQSIETRLELMDRLGIDVQVLSVSQAQPYLAEAADAAEAARLGNDLYVDVCRRFPGRFFTLAALPLPHVSESLEEIDRAMADEDVVGVTIGCSINEMHVDDPSLEPVYAELNRRKAPVLLHPRGERCVVDGEDYNLNWLVGAPFEDTVAALRLAMSGIGDRYPDIRFIVPHFGGTLPFLLARVLRMTGGRGEEALRRMHYDTVSGSVEALRCAADFWGADRLLYGTDYPYSDEYEFERRLTYLDEADLDRDELDRIRGSRAIELLGLAERLAAVGSGAAGAVPASPSR
jgi:aminocarboxymuconate-semialdehyde decarboxylase